MNYLIRILGFVVLLIAVILLIIMIMNFDQVIKGGSTVAFFRFAEMVVYITAGVFLIKRRD